MSGFFDVRCLPPLSVELFRASSRVGMAAPRIVGGALGGRHQPRAPLDLSEEARASRRASREELAEAAAAAAAAAPAPALAELPDDEQASPRELLLSAQSISPGARRRNAAAEVAEQQRQAEEREAAQKGERVAEAARTAAAVHAAKESLLKAVSRSRKQTQDLLEAQAAAAAAYDEDPHLAWVAEREAASELPYEWAEATSPER